MIAKILETEKIEGAEHTISEKQSKQAKELKSVIFKAIEHATSMGATFDPMDGRTEQDFIDIQQDENM